MDMTADKKIIWTGTTNPVTVLGRIKGREIAIVTKR